jgi:hypothetical protein
MGMLDERIPDKNQESGKGLQQLCAHHQLKKITPVIDFRLSLLYKGKKVINRGIAYASLYAPNILKAESVRL